MSRSTAISAHRGGGEHAREGTYEAYRSALETGVLGWCPGWRPARHVGSSGAIPAGATLLGDRDMRLFLAAQGLDSLAIGVAGVALPWLLLSEGHSVGLAGLVYPVTIVPFVVFGLPAGALGDRLAWRRVMYASHATQAVASASIPLWALSGPPPLALVLTAAFVVGSGRVFADAAAFGAVASVVGPENFIRGQSALSAVWSIGFLAGPALAGLLVAAIGPSFALAAEASALVIAAR